MLRLAWRSVLVRWPRLLLTALAIVASTAFLSGTFVFKDTIQRTFDALFADVYDRVDGYVQSSQSVENLFGLERRDRLPDSVLDEVRAIPGVADAQPVVQDDAVVSDKDGKPIERPTAPTFGAAISAGDLSVWRVREGRLPAGDTEVVLDNLTAADGGYSLGDSVTVTSNVDSRSFTLVGIVEYDDIIAPGNATWALFDPQTAEGFIAKDGFIDAVLVRGDGTLPPDQLVQRINATLDPEVAETLTSQQITEQSQTEIEKSLNFLTLFLTIFSMVALVVGIFVIYNVFSITAAQRQRENALLRALGASRRQVSASLLIEALITGVIGSMLGLFAGVALAGGVKRLLATLDFEIPARGLVLDPRTVIVTLLAGTGASLVSALGPAIGAGRIPPVAAMSDAILERVGSVRRRVIAAAVSALIGVAAIVAVLGGADGTLLAVGVVGLFAALLLLGPALAKPIGRFIGAPVQRFKGVTGTMARGNVQRNPRRTARTAAPVLIGVALVTGASVFAASIKEQVRDTFGATFVGEYVVNSTKGGSVSLPQTFVDDVNALPEVGTASGLGFAIVVGSDGKPEPGAVINPVTAEGLLNLQFVQGSMADLTPGGVLMSVNEAKGKQRGSVASPNYKGVGRGHIRFYANDAGDIKGIAFNFDRAKFHGLDDWSIVVGRPRISASATKG